MLVLDKCNCGQGVQPGHDDCLDCGGRLERFVGVTHSSPGGPSLPNIGTKLFSIWDRTERLVYIHIVLGEVALEAFLTQEDIHFRLTHLYRFIPQRVQPESQITDMEIV